MSIFGQTILNEVYFGETKEITKLFEQFCKIRDKYLHKKLNDKINKDPLTTQFNRMVEKTFGFGAFSLIVDGYGINAYTYPISSVKKDKWDLDKHFKPTKNGFKYTNTSYNTMVYITPKLFYNETFTDRELFAIFLHEIGHNFNTVIYAPIDLASVGLKNVIDIENKLFKSILSEDSTTKIIQDIGAENKNIFIKDILINVAKETCGLLDLFSMPIITALNKIGNIILNILFPKYMMLRKRYDDEIISDSFATIYGFGPDLIKGIDKMESVSLDTYSTKTTEMVPLIFQMVNLSTVMIEILTHGFNSHPNYSARLSQQIYLLRSELAKDDIDPKMRKSIESDLDEIEDYILKYKDNYKITNPLLFQKLYHAIMYNICGGDIREIIIKDNIPEKIDSVYKK